MTTLEAETAINELVGINIMNKRKKLGYSGQFLADCIGISQQQLSRYERGNSRISVEMLFKVSVILKEPISYFLISEPIH